MDYNILLNMVLHLNAFASLLCALLLFARRKDSDKSRVILAFCYATWGVMVLASVVYHYDSVTFTINQVFSIISLNIVVLDIFIMSLYPTYVIYPGRKSIINIILIFIPYLIVNVIIWLFKIEFRELHSFNEILQYIGEYNVWIRFVFIIYMLIVILFVFYLPYRNTRSCVNLNWIRKYILGMLGIMFFYIIWLFTGTVMSNIILNAYCVVFCLIMTYQELYTRISLNVGESIEHDDANINAKIHADKSPLHKRLLSLLHEKPLWRDPDITITDLATMLGTNRTTLSKVIKDAGYDGFYGLINTCRVKEFIYIIEHEKIKGIHDTFYDVGFRSKATAIRYFRQQTGVTPSSYIQQLVATRNVNQA
ncbi:MAG: AraC family transcriptional regulator [Rikenellaceae bacterium]